jgi:hypothetical protein
MYVYPKFMEFIRSNSRSRMLLLNVCRRRCQAGMLTSLDDLQSEPLFAVGTDASSGPSCELWSAT